MTEDEAKTKWCPFARKALWDPQIGTVNGSANRQYYDDGPTTSCLASACMAWRWGGKFVDGPPNTSDGNCGLAGVTR